MHVLDWLDGGDFIPSINKMLEPTRMFVHASGERMPKGWNDQVEARLGKECRTLLKRDVSTQVRDWWLAVWEGANVPNWDLACAALISGDRPALVLAEAKAHVQEFSNAGKPKGGNEANDAKIRLALSEASDALSKHARPVALSAEQWYQFSNRIAFAWKLAAQGIPTALLYLGFTQDTGIRDVEEPLRDHDHWRQTVLKHTSEVLSPAFWEREIDCGDAPLWLLVQSRNCIRPSPTRDAR